MYIYIPFSVIHLEYPPIPTETKPRGRGDTLEFLAQLQSLGIARWYVLRRGNQSSRADVRTRFGSKTMKGPEGPTATAG